MEHRIKDGGELSENREKRRGGETDVRERKKW
jgi:hypothetical protein